MVRTPASSALAAYRQQAWEQFKNLPLPTVQDEAWRRTDIKNLHAERYRFPAADAHLDLPAVNPDLLTPLTGDAHGGQVILFGAHQAMWEWAQCVRHWCNGDAVYCISENSDLAYAVPKEGSNVWFDNIIIPKTSKHTAEAEQFINFLCDAKVAAQNSDYIGFSTPNAAALALMDPAYAADPTYNPPQDVLDRCQIFQDLGDFVKAFSDAWTKVKAA